MPNTLQHLLAVALQLPKDEPDRQNHHVYDPNLSSVACYSPTHYDDEIASSSASSSPSAPISDESVDAVDVGDIGQRGSLGDRYSSGPPSNGHQQPVELNTSDELYHNLNTAEISAHHHLQTTLTPSTVSSATPTAATDLMPATTVEDAELLYGLYGSAFRYDIDYNGDGNRAMMANDGIPTELDEAAEMLTTLLDHHQQHHQQQQLERSTIDGPASMQSVDRMHLDGHQHRRRGPTYNTDAMMPLLAAVNDIAAREEQLYHGAATDSHTVCPATHPASDYMLMNGQFVSHNAELINTDVCSENFVAAMSLTTLRSSHTTGGGGVSAEYVDLSYINRYLDGGTSAAVTATFMPLLKVTDKLEDNDDEEFIVADSHVPIRAWASLPIGHLSITQLANGNELAVFAITTIPVRTKFGPIEGDMRTLLPAEQELMKSDSHRRLPVLFTNGNQLVDVSNENTSNWMRFVRLAHNDAEQNLQLHESVDNRLYFRTCRPIHAQQELKVSYARSYAQRYGLPLLDGSVQCDTMLLPEPPINTPPLSPVRSHHPILATPDSGNITNNYATAHTPADKQMHDQLPPAPLPPICDSWPCFECHQRFDTFSQLQLHVNAVHDPANALNYPDRIAMRWQRLRRRRRQQQHRKRLAIGGARVRYDCRHCARVFSKYAALTRHCDREHDERCDGGGGFGALESGNERVDRSDDDDDEEDDDDDVEEEEEEEGGEEIDRIDVGDDPNSNKIYINTNQDIVVGDAPADATKPPRRTSARHKCHTCRRYFSNAERLAKHQQLHENVDGQLPQTNSDRRTGGVQCAHCPRRLLTSSAMAMHMRKHTQAVNVAVHATTAGADGGANAGGKSSEIVSEIAANVVISMAARFQCVYCAQPFSTPATLNGHVMAAHADNPGGSSMSPTFGCPLPQCGQHFGTYAKVRQHVNSVHTEANVACPDCGRLFKKPHKMQLHRRIHDGAGGRFGCDRVGCERRFHRRDKLLEHCRRVHDEGGAGGGGNVNAGGARRRRGRPPKAGDNHTVALADDCAMSAQQQTSPSNVVVGEPLAEPLPTAKRANRRKPVAVPKRRVSSTSAVEAFPRFASTADFGIDCLELIAAPLHRLANADESYMIGGDVGVNDSVAEEVAAFTAAETFSNYCRNNASDVEDIGDAADDKPADGADCNDDVALYYDTLVDQTQSTQVKHPHQPDYDMFVYKCTDCRIGFKRRGMLVNHLVRAHPTVDVRTVAVLNMPIVQPQRQYCCPYCAKVYGSSSKRRLHIGKQHPGKALPATLQQQHRGGRKCAGDVDVGEGGGGGVDATASCYTRTVGSVTAVPHSCAWCYKQYATRQRLLRHQRLDHGTMVTTTTSMIIDVV